MNPVPCIAGAAYAFPRETLTLGELASAGLLESDPGLLKGYGFHSVHVAIEESPYELALRAASRLLEEHEIDPATIGLLVYTGTPGTAAFAPGFAPPPERSFLRTTERFRYPSTRLQYDLGIERASVLALDQLACTGLFGAVRVARAICTSEGVERALCVSAEFFPAEAGREAIFNCTSDAACAVLVERDGERNRMVAASHVTKGYYWDAEGLKDQVVASYFPTAKHVIDHTLAAAGWSPASTHWVIPHNVSLRSWDILLALTGLSGARLWACNVARDGHTLAGDNFINLSDALETESVRPGERMLLFSYGYGAHWTALALEA
jgi:3-oxoacyl-[acyl-carrier-protein] synthase III